MQKIKLIGISILLAATSVFATACSPENDLTDDFGRQALCATGDVGIASLRAGNAGARAVASIIVNTSDNEQIVNLAQMVLNENITDDARNQLADWLYQQCH